MKCKLCLQERELQNSHIIPEFLYKPLYDRLHRCQVLSINEDEKNKYVQKGIREKSLCSDCEQLLCIYEKYANEVLSGGVEIEIENYPNRIIVRNIDYKKFKLFQLSILWRASVSSDKFFSEINLSCRPHEEKICKMILSEKPP